MDLFLGNCIYVQAALHFLGSVSGLVRKATERVQKTKAAKKLQQKEEEAAGARRSSAMGYTGSRAFRQAGPHILTSCRVLLS